ncbi:serine/threonine-protein kinase PRP4 homolog [Papilio machaon]|uniref:serine/threonine-protein kinase PRP4 homolog n=1 Tax=Papilio machaon TaxID=76193 RepID=UPI001E66604B|nr:serine/threonine-protein kinase PRP4 homolog [Papilio machaon]XP_045537468.1 serine/threonine-protein kinase PRP4 homolog [Papilio machaon]XP_045537469.1 serine/threonine-protein kinase PRP4 homolog [Papilio machaon]
MAECNRTNYRKSNHKSSRSDRKIESVREHGKKTKVKHTDSRTPPLPIMEDFSMEELLKKRKLLCANLEKYKTYSYNETKMLKDANERKRKHVNGDKQDNKSKKYNADAKTIKEPSPEYNQEGIHISESEDEEYIIEQRRKQRKQLLDHLNNSQNIINIEEDSKIQNTSQVDCEIENNDTANSIKSTGKEITDMFSEKDEFPKNKDPEVIIQDNNDKNAELADNWDDEEGYYKARVGDCINNNRYTVKSILGQGVFANVVRAQDHTFKGNEVAIKIIRNNELMQKTGLKEMAILKEINDNDPDDKYHCVKLLRNFIHKGHLCLVLEPFYMDMRSLLKKYGKHNGISLKALMIYTRQLFLALKLLSKIGVIHADIKPDNILVNENKNVLKLCDFGSAAKVNENEPTPYLVSRFYRAPEIILGIPYSYGIDIWSTACTVYEMATNNILFTGGSNNKMLKCFMDLKGKIPSKLLRRSKFKDQHFNYKNNFLLRKKDKVTEREKVVEMNHIVICRDLQRDLKQYFKKLTSSEEKKVVQLKDLLDKMLMLDDKQRLSVTDGLKHSFIQVQI